MGKDAVVACADAWLTSPQEWPYRPIGCLRRAAARGARAQRARHRAAESVESDSRWRSLAESPWPRVPAHPASGQRSAGRKKLVRYGWAHRRSARASVCCPVCNEFMWAIRRDALLGVFPDPISVFDSRSALPLSSTQVRPRSDVAVLVVPHSHLPLGSPMTDHALLRPIKRIFAADASPQLILEHKRTASAVG